MKEKSRNFQYSFERHLSKNFLIRKLVKKFLDNIIDFIVYSRAKIILDVGCGDGYFTNYIRETLDVEIQGLDISNSIIKKARKNYSKIDFFIGSVYDLPYDQDSFDMVLALELIEHLKNPAKALKNMKQVAKNFCIVSVPNEPFWKISNILRGAYLSDFGNTPGHIQHWTTNQFKNFMKKHFETIKIKAAFPWNIALCGKNDERKSENMKAQILI